MVLELPGFVCNPSQYAFRWDDDYLDCIQLRFKAIPGHPAVELGTAVNGEVSLYVASVRIGSIPISVFLTEDAAPARGDGLVSASPVLHEKVFVSYSHADQAVIDAITAAARVLGIQFLRDQIDLRSGDAWSERLLAFIEEADVFQLFWSESARGSPHVQAEWRFALGLNRRGFIRPVFWQKPMPEPPPELCAMHFSYYERAGGTPGSGADAAERAADAPASRSS